MGSGVAHGLELLLPVQLLPLRAAHLPFAEPQGALQTVPDCSSHPSPEQWGEISIPTSWNLELGSL